MPRVTHTHKHAHTPLTKEHTNIAITRSQHRQRETQNRHICFCDRLCSGPRELLLHLDSPWCIWLLVNTIKDWVFDAANVEFEHCFRAREQDVLCQKTRQVNLSTSLSVPTLAMGFSITVYHSPGLPSVHFLASLADLICSHGNIHNLAWRLQQLPRVTRRFL